MRRTVKKYFVKSKNEEGKKKTKKFDNLKEARVFAGEKLREGRFLALTNFKRIPLPI